MTSTRLLSFLPLFFILAALLVPRHADAAPAPAKPACTASQALFFHNAPRQYVKNSELNVHHGSLLSAQTFTPFLASIGSVTPFAFCVQRGVFLFVASSGSAASGADQYTAQLDGATVATNQVMAPGTISFVTTSTGAYSGIDPRAILNVTGLSSTGAPLAPALHTFLVTLSSSADTCTPVTYKFILSNPTCASTFLHVHCAFALLDGFRICRNPGCTLSAVEYGNFLVLQGGAPVQEHLSLTGSRYYVRFGTFDSAKVTVRVNGQWVTAANGDTIPSLAPHVFTSSPSDRFTLDLPWSTTTKNMLWFNISGYGTGENCYEEGFQYIFGNVGVNLNDACPIKASGPCATDGAVASSSGAFASSSAAFASSSAAFTSSSGGGGGVVGDPQFMGLRGQSFQVHGIDGGVYNIISNTQMQLNAKFVFLTGPRACPVLPSTGKRSLSCWTHDGLYLADLALLTAAGDRVHIVPGVAADGLSSVVVNGDVVSAGEEVELRDESGPVRSSVKFASTHELILRVNLFEIHLENIDGFINLSHVQVVTQGADDVGSDGKFAKGGVALLRDMHTHGLLGQTWHVHRYNNRLRAIEGEVDDYLINNGDLFGSDFVFNQFGATRVGDVMSDATVSSVSE